MKIDYSVVIPVYNSEKSLEELCSGIISVFKKSEKNIEIIFVDDFSSDDSWEKIKILKENYPEIVKGIKLSKNFGQHNATLCGFNFSNGEYIITIDDDLQTMPPEINKLIAAQKENNSDLTYGISSNKKHSAYRNIGSKSLKKTSKKLYNAPGEGSSFRLINKELVKKILQHNHNFIYLDEIFFWYTDEIAFVEVEHCKRKYEKSGYSSRKLLKLFSNIIIYYTTIPLKFMVYGGMIFSIISFILGIIFIVKKIFFNVPLGYTSLMVTILFSTSIILLGLGTIGEYLRRIYMVQNKKPSYSIKKILK